MADAEAISLFTSIGLSEQKAKETLKNKDVTEKLKAIILEVSVCEVSCSDLYEKYKFLCD